MLKWLCHLLVRKVYGIDARIFTPLEDIPDNLRFLRWVSEEYHDES